MSQLFEARLTRPGRSAVNPGNWLDWQRQSQTLQSLAAWGTAPVTLETPSGGERVETLVVSAEFFPLLGVAPALGRVIGADDDRPNAPPVAVLAYRTWRNRYGGSPSVIGSRILLNGASTEIIGVMPASFRFVTPDTEFYRAFQLDRTAPWQAQGGRFISVVARAKAGVTLVAVQAEMTTIAARLRIHPMNEGRTVEVVPIREELVGDIRRPVLAVYGAVLLLLGIANLNVAGLLMARAAARRSEFATRASIGASRLALMRPAMLESVLLAGFGGALGILIARLTIDALLRVAPADVLPIAGFTMNGWILFYALAISVATGLLAGMAPAVLLARRTLAATIRLHTRTATSEHRLRHGLVAMQVALTMVLLCGAGVFSRTVAALADRDTGVRAEGLLTMQVDLPQEQYDEDRRVFVMRQIRDRLRQLPGVTAVGAGFSLPVTGGILARTSFSVLGAPVQSASESPSAAIRMATPGYFATLGTPVLKGREFADADERPGAPLAFVVNQAFVRAFLAGADPLSTSLSVRMQRENPFARIVGVVGDTSEGSLWDEGQPTIYYSHRQLPSRSMAVVVRTLEPLSLARVVGDVIHEVDGAARVADVRPLTVAFRASLVRERLIAMTSSGFALSGLLLASVGLYGLLSFVVSERTREIGIRIALGAQVGTLLRGVLVRALAIVALGAAVGTILTALALRTSAAFLFGVTPYDPTTYVGVLSLLTVVSTAAALVPARRAVRLDPVKALRAE